MIQQECPDAEIGVTDLLVKACAVTPAARPEASASWAGDRILRHRHVTVGVAVSVSDAIAPGPGGQLRQAASSRC